MERPPRREEAISEVDLGSPGEEWHVEEEEGEEQIAGERLGSNF